MYVTLWVLEIYLKNKIWVQWGNSRRSPRPERQEFPDWKKPSRSHHSRWKQTHSKAQCCGISEHWGWSSNSFFFLLRGIKVLEKWFGIRMDSDFSRTAKG